MLKIKDKDGKLKFVLRDTDEEPTEIDQLVLKDASKQKAKESVKEEKNAKPN